MTIEKIKQLLEQNLGISCSNMTLTSKLGETDIGLDSQEIVEFTAMMEGVFKIKLPPVCFCKASSIQDVLQTVQEAQKKGCSPSSVFEGRAEAFLEINCSAEEAYRAIYELEKWPEKLPHVKRIEVLYNDGVYQEFLMDVQSETGMIYVRSIRRCLAEEGITFFQPQPPKFLKHHCGGWNFRKQGDSCLVTTWHQWNLERPKAQEIFPIKNGLLTESQISRLLLSHAEVALNTWKTVLEGVYANS